MYDQLSAASSKRPIEPITEPKLKSFFLSKKTLAAVMIFVILFLLLPQHQAKAAGCQLVGFNLIDCSVELLGTIALFSLGNLLSWTGQQFEHFIQPDTQSRALNYEPVLTSWRTIRDFINMFFILILIIMAFGTIFNIEKYSWHNLLAPFLIAAIFINFSYVIVQYIITIGNGLAAVFMNAINNQDISQLLMKGAGIQGFFTLDQNGQLSILASGSGVRLITTLIFAIIFSVMILIAFATAFIFSLIRIPILWFLIILSPAAIFCYALPNLQKPWNKWRSALISWTFFLPVYLFFLMFAFIFLGNNNPEQLTGTPISSSFLNSFFQNVFTYVLTLIFLVGGLYMAKQTGDLTAMGVGSAFKWTNEKVKRFFPGRNIYEGAKQGLKARGEEIKEKGVFGIGGEQATRLKQATWAERFGAVSGGTTTRGLYDKQLADEVNKLKGEYERITDVNKLKEMMDKGSLQQQLAVREVLKGRDALDAKELVKTFEMYGGPGSLTALKFARGIDYNAMSSEGRKYMFENINDAEIKRKIALARAEKEDYKRAGPEELKSIASLFIQEGDRAAFLNKVRKTNMKNAVEALADLELYKDKDRNVIKDRNAALANAMSGMNLDSILEISADNLKEMRKNSEVDDIIKNKITKENLGLVKNKANKQQLEKDVLGDLIDERAQEIKTEEQEKMNKQAEIQQKGNQPLTEALEKLVKQQQSQQQPPPSSPPPPQTPPPSGLVNPYGRPVSSSVERDRNPKITLASENNIIDLRNKSDNS